MNKIFNSPLKRHSIFRFIDVFMAQTSNLGGSFILSTIKKVLDEFSTADEENECTTESELTGCI
jgi:hypothetical protein